MALHVHVFALVVMLLGLGLYLASGSDRPKGAEVGRLMFFAGLLVLLLASPSPSLRIFDR